MPAAVWARPASPESGKGASGIGRRRPARAMPVPPSPGSTPVRSCPATPPGAAVRMRRLTGMMYDCAGGEATAGGTPGQGVRVRET
jgi:hypothetical protein